MLTPKAREVSEKTTASLPCCKQERAEEEGEEEREEEEGQEPVRVCRGGGNPGDVIVSGDDNARECRVRVRGGWVWANLLGQRLHDTAIPEEHRRGSQQHSGERRAQVKQSCLTIKSMCLSYRPV